MRVLAVGDRNPAADRGTDALLAAGHAVVDSGAVLAEAGAAHAASAAGTTGDAGEGLAVGLAGAAGAAAGDADVAFVREPAAAGAVPAGLPAVGLLLGGAAAPAGVRWVRPAPGPAFEQRAVAPWRWRLLAFDGAATALLDALPEARLVVEGDGVAGERVRVQHSHPDVLVEAYAGSDAVLAPDAGRALEAMAVGRPVVSAAADPVLRDGENALVTADVAAAVRRLAGDPELRARLRNGGIATVERLAGFPATVVAELAACRRAS